MKKLAFLSLIALFVMGCSNGPQDMAENAVKTHLKKSVTAYESISFGKLDTINLSNNSEYVAVRDSFRFYMDALKETGDQFKLADNQKNASRLKIIKEDIEKFFEGKTYSINHKYKGNTAEGGVKEVDKEFYLDGTYHIVE